MKYTTGEGFRQVLESRIIKISSDSGIPIIRLRKMVAFDRFLIRLIQNQPDMWVLKGGFALQLRLGDRARTTKDIDLLLREEDVDIHKALQSAGFLDIGDWFSFEVPPSPRDVFGVPGVSRFNVRTILDGRLFEAFHVDIGVGDPVVSPVEHLATTDILSFAGLEPTLVPCYPINQQIAEKLHAYTRPRGKNESSRVKDFVDILVLAELIDLEKDDLMSAIQATFDHAGTHSIPSEIPQPPSSWRQPYTRLAREVGLGEISFDEAYTRLQIFVNPIITDRIGTAIWVPSIWEWSD